jgi:hypothetical protein
MQQHVEKLVSTEGSMHCVRKCVTTSSCSDEVATRGRVEQGVPQEASRLQDAVPVSVGINHPLPRDCESRLRGLKLIDERAWCCESRRLQRGD